MKLINEKEVNTKSESKEWFDGLAQPSSDFQIGFILGSKWTQEKLTPLMIEFGKLCFTKGKESDYSCTISELLEQFIKSKE